MTEQTKITAAAGSNEEAPKAKKAEKLGFGPDFAGTEHPETARLRIHQEFVDSIIGIKRLTFDQNYAYLCGLLDQAKVELGHARSASNDVRRATLQQHIDEIVAYCSGHGIRPKLPNRNGDKLSEALATFYVIEEIPSFLGEIKLLIDLWYEKQIDKVHEEMLALTGLSARVKSAEKR
jgi:hypothetical protein